MSDAIEAPVVGAKVLGVSGRRLVSPVAIAHWPVSLRGYRSARGFFFWAFPTAWLSLARPMHSDEILAIVRVLPHDTPGLTCIEPAGQPTWPSYAPTIPPGADCVVARNMVGIARAIQIDHIILHPAYSAPVGDYGRLVIPDNYSDRPIEVSANSWRVRSALLPMRGNYETVDFSRYDEDAHCWRPSELRWHDAETRDKVQNLMSETLAAPEASRRWWMQHCGII
ncbi:MAG: hypothetical protein KatS3mg087_1089 [Patescibacteria group bacterium]|nr:MAG: hypothetical protein KatS3mg087_1089 [Patescibacteria group bacterium]